jgi:predicted NUDIX family NTP pyrophosphohydrolase
MVDKSAGILLYKRVGAGVEVWIAHMGGPFWARKDAGAWSIPKGLYDDDEHALSAAVREFEEEIGLPAPDVDYELLGEFRQSSGKVVTAFIGESDLVVETIMSNLFSLEWPPKSGRMQEFPEIDDARWFPVAVAREKLVKGQVPMLDALERRLA